MTMSQTWGIPGGWLSAPLDPAPPRLDLRAILHPATQRDPASGDTRSGTNPGDDRLQPARRFLQSRSSGTRSLTPLRMMKIESPHDPSGADHIRDPFGARADGSAATARERELPVRHCFVHRRVDLLWTSSGR